MTRARNVPNFTVILTNLDDDSQNVAYQKCDWFLIGSDRCHEYNRASESNPGRITHTYKTHTHAYFDIFSDNNYFQLPVRVRFVYRKGVSLFVLCIVGHGITTGEDMHGRQWDGVDAGAGVGVGAPTRG